MIPRDNADIKMSLRHIDTNEDLIFRMSVQRNPCLVNTGFKPKQLFGLIIIEAGTLQFARRSKLTILQIPLLWNTAALTRALE